MRDSRKELNVVEVILCAVGLASVMFMLIIKSAWATWRASRNGLLTGEYVESLRDATLAEFGRRTVNEKDMVALGVRVLAVSIIVLILL